MSIGRIGGGGPLEIPEQPPADVGVDEVVAQILQQPTCVPDDPLDKLLLMLAEGLPDDRIADLVGRLEVDHPELAARLEQIRMSRNTDHPGAPSGYGGIQPPGSLPDDVKKAAEDLHNRRPPPPLGHKEVYLGEDGQRYVLCVERRGLDYENSPKGVSAYQQDPLNPSPRPPRPPCPPPPPPPGPRV